MTRKTHADCEAEERDAELTKRLAGASVKVVLEAVLSGCQTDGVMLNPHWVVAQMRLALGKLGNDEELLQDALTAIRQLKGVAFIGHRRRDIDPLLTRSNDVQLRIEERLL